MRFLRHSLTGLLLFSLTLGLLAYAGHLVFTAVQERLAAEPQIPQRRERVFAVRTVTAQAETITPVLTAFGEVQSRRTLEIRARTGGTLVELSDAFVEGGRVEQGQLLARIDPADASAALDRAESDLMDARAEVGEADRGLTLARDELASARDQATLRERALTRQRNLEERGVGTAAAVETAELSAAQAAQAVLVSRRALALAEARVNQAKTALNRARIARDETQRRLDETRITAGFSGTLSDVSVVAGRLVSGNEQLARLVDANDLEVAFRVSTPQYARLLDDQGHLIAAPITVTLDVFGLDLVARGSILRDSAVVGDGQTGRQIFAALDHTPGFKPGDFVTVEVREPPLDRAVRLPASALGADGAVLAVTAQDRLRAVPVTLLRRQGDDIIVAAGDVVGQDVVTQRSPLLGAGIKVRRLQDMPEASTAVPNLLELSDDRRQKLKAFVAASTDMPDEVKTRLLGQLDAPRVPAGMVQRLERRMGG